MKYKLSLSLLTAMALSSGQLYAAIPKIDEVCKTPGTCSVTNNNNTNGSTTNTAINITGSTIKNITADSSNLWAGSGNTQIDKIELKNNSLLEDGGGMVLDELSSDGSAKIIHNGGTTNIKKITSTTLGITTKTDFESKDGYLDIGDKVSTVRNEIKNAFFHGVGSVRFYNVKADSSIVADLGYVLLEGSELDGTTINTARDLTIRNNIIKNVTLKAPSGLVERDAEGNTFIDSKIDAHGTYKGNTFTNTEVGLNVTEKIHLENNTFEGGKLKAKGMYTNNTFNTTEIITDFTGADPYMHLKGKNEFTDVKMHQTTADHKKKHNVALDSNTETIFTNSTLDNISINGFGTGTINNKLTITGGTLTNTTIGSHETNTKIADLTLDGVTINNSGVTNLSHNIRAQNITITNVTSATGAKINAQAKLDMTGSTLDVTSAITAKDATITTSTVNGTTNVTNKLTATGSIFGSKVTANDLISSGAGSKFDGIVNITNSITASDTTFTKDVTANTITANSGSVFGGITKANDSITANSGSIFNGATTATNTITSTGATFGGAVNAKDLVSQKDATNVNSTFNGIVNITNSITASDTTFTKDVTANTITANANSSFNANTTATNKITSDGAKFGGIVKANELETKATNKSTFSGNVDIASKITSANASFEAQVKTAFLDAQKDSTFEANSNVIATDINAVGATFSGTIAKNNSITADSSTFANAIDTGKLTASNGSKFSGTVKAGDLETLAGAIASSFTNTVNVTNTLTSTNANFTGNVTAGSIVANDKATFGGATPTTVTANTITANAGSSFKANVSATNKITSNGATFEKEINTAFLEANAGSTFGANSNVNATDIKATGSTFSGTIAKNNSITADSSSFANAIDTGKLITTNGSSFADVTANTIEATNSTFGGIVTAADTITANSGANFKGEVNSKYIIANNGSVFDANSKVVVTDSIIANAGSKFNGSVTTDFLAADKGAEFIGTTDVKQLYAKGSNFGGTVTISCDKPDECESVIDDSTFNNLTLKEQTKVTLDNGSIVNGNLTLETDKNVAIIEGGSSITGDIENHGEIYVNNGTISSKITGTGDLFTSQVTYEKDVSLSDIKNSSNATYNGITTVSKDATVDNSTFTKDFNVGGKLTAYQGNVFNTVSANSADFSYNASKGEKKEISANSIDVATGLLIDNINVKSEKSITASTATIKNKAEVTSDLIKGTGDNAAKVYEANIAKGNTYNIDSSKVVGGIRADKLTANNSIIQAQVATNTLNATNTTFYIYGNGTNTSFYDGYSGAIIAREGAIGSGNSIQLANTDLSKLTNGLVPIAIVKQNTTNRSDTSSSIGEDFFKVTYKSKLAMYELVDKYKDFADINGNYVWSVGLGDNSLNASNIDDVINGVDSTNLANGKGIFDRTSLEVNVGDMFKPIDFDKEAIDTAKFILTSPEYVVKTKTNTLNKRFRALKDHRLGNGFWLDNEMGYAKYEYNAIRYKNMSVGIDKTHEFNDSDLSVGLAAVVGHAETKGNLNSDADSKGFGVYALNKFNNNAFVGASAFYHNIASSYDADILDVHANKNHNVYEASVEGGARFGDSVYFEPSLKYHLTSYKPTAITQKGLILKGDSQLKHELTATLEGGFKVPNIFDAYLAVGLSKELNHKPDLTFIDELKIENKVDGSKGDTSVGINFGVDYKLSPKASFNIDLGSNLYNNSDKELKGNIGFNYQF